MRHSLTHSGTLFRSPRPVSKALYHRLCIRNSKPKALHLGHCIPGTAFGARSPLGWRWTSRVPGELRQCPPSAACIFMFTRVSISGPTDMRIHTNKYWSVNTYGRRISMCVGVFLLMFMYVHILSLSLSRSLFVCLCIPRLSGCLCPPVSVSFVVRV